MSITVGTNSYVTIADADTYISGHYRSNNTDKKRWDELEEEDKEVCLVNACELIEVLPFQGRKALSTQTMQFPRLPMQYCHTEEGTPANVKQAQIELALYLSNDEAQADAEQRKALQTQGVKSFSVGKLSEAYATDTSIKSAAYLCTKCMDKLKPYLNGGYATC